ncbi:hypothetical protein BDD43_3416 [Mucilaginibacter gracilis]|uniref:AraC-like protein n=1 Tax=Mucilaginibacter gracilis TaxID=423350 RepID=A0A495J4E7_9SPHI|nr:hypothetical protein [Mucilaginibacter gracilis]RKR83214.1 hypothetical protein BDD43_3416 [Mucilaginibacter gracilis]
MKLYKKKVIQRIDNKPYLIRYSLFTCRWFAVKVHNIILSDFECQHDHPWAFVTILLKGGYVEYTQTGSKVYGRGSVLYRPAESLHRLEIHQPVWSLVITFKKVRQWGFLTPRGWIKWFDYSSTDSCK